MTVTTSAAAGDAEPPIEQRLERFAGHLRSHGHDVQSRAEAVRWLALAVENTERGTPTFDMSTGKVLNRSFDTEISQVVLDAAAADAANADPRDAMARDHQQVVAQIVRERQTVLDRPAASVFDTRDGQAVAELNPWRPDFQEWVRQQGNERLVEAVGVDERGVSFGQRLGSALALQHAADGYAEISKYAVPDEFLDPRAPYPDAPRNLVHDRQDLERRRANGEFPAHLADGAHLHAVRLSMDRDLTETNRVLAEARERDAAARSTPMWARRPRVGGRARARQEDLRARTNEVDHRLAESATRWNRYGEHRRAELARATAELSDKPATTPEQRFIEFAAYARGRGCDVRTPGQVVQYLEDGRHWTAHGQRWFDTTAPEGAKRDPVYLSGPVGDRIRDGMARAEAGTGNVATNRAMLKVVKEAVDSGLHVANGVPLHVTDTPDGRAVNRLRLKDPETQRYLGRLARQDPAAGAVLRRMSGSTERFANRVHDAVAHQFAMDALYNLSGLGTRAVRVNAHGTAPPDHVVAQDRKELTRLGISRATDGFLGIWGESAQNEMRELDILRSGQHQGHSVGFDWEGDGHRPDYRADDRRVQRIELARKMDREAARLGEPRLSPELTRPGEPLHPARFYPPNPWAGRGHPEARTSPLPATDGTPRPRTVNPYKRERNPVRFGHIRGGEHDVRVAGRPHDPGPERPR